MKDIYYNQWLAFGVQKLFTELQDRSQVLGVEMRYFDQNVINGLLNVTKYQDKMSRDANKFFKQETRHNKDSLKKIQKGLAKNVGFMDKFKFNPVMLDTETFKYIHLSTLPERIRFIPDHYQGRKVSYNPFTSF